MSIELIEFKNKKYIFLDKCDNDNGDTKNREFRLYDENNNIVNIDIKSNNWCIFDNKISICSNEDIKIYDENFNHIKTIHKRYHEIKKYIFNNKKYYFGYLSKNGYYYDIYDEDFNIKLYDVNINDVFEKMIVVSNQNNNGVYDENLKKIFSFNHIGKLTKFNDNSYYLLTYKDVNNKNLYDIYKYNDKNFELVFNSSNYFMDFKNNTYLINNKNENSKLYDKNMNVIKQYNSAISYGLYDNIINREYNDYFALKNIETNKYGIINTKTGDVVVDFIYNKVSLTKNGFYFETDKNYGLCDYSNNIIIQCNIK